MCPNTLPEDYAETDTITGSGTIGCAPSQLDTDGDSVTDDLDLCPDTTLGATVTSDGCIVVGADTDSDGVEDAIDDFPSEPTQWVDSDDDGFGDNWADGTWNSSREVENIGVWILNAVNPDYCPEEFGLSDNSAWSGTGAEIILGCLDSDGDGWADSIDWSPLESSQWEDLDDDDFGDNASGVAGDQCIGQPGIGDVDGDGPHKNGCPAPDADNDGVFNNVDDCQGTALNSTVDSDGCADYQLDTDEDGVSNDLDQCPSTPAGDWSKVYGEDTDDDSKFGCTDAQLAENEGASMGDSFKLIGIVLGVIVAVAVLILVIRRIRGGGIDWDDDEDDFYDDDEDDNDDWSPFSGSATSMPSRTFSSEPTSPKPSSSPPSAGSRGPPSRASSGGSQGPPGRSRGPPVGSSGSGPPVRSGPPVKSGPSGPSRTPRESGPSSRPTTTPQPSESIPTTPARKTRRTAVTSVPEDKPVRKTRKTASGTSAEPVQTAAPVRKARRTTAPAKQSRKRKAKASFDDLFGADEKADFDTAVEVAKERLIVGDSEQSVLARLQSEGWNVKQSKHILGHARL